MKSRFLLAVSILTVLLSTGLAVSFGAAAEQKQKSSFVAGEVTSFQHDGRSSLIRVGSAPTRVTPDGLEVAEKVWNAILNKDVRLAEEAILDYDRLIPSENLGGDYTALQWLMRDFVATRRGEKPQYDYGGQLFREHLAGDDYRNLKEYLQRTYGVGGFKIDEIQKHKDRVRILQDYVMFMNPAREQWESSAAILKVVGLKPGEKVADIGCGLGYFALRMAKEVGPTGKIFAIDTEKEYTERVAEFAKRENAQNVVTVVSEFNDARIPEPVDVAFIASLYHVIYGWSTEPNRRGFLESIKRALKPDGRLVIVDNLANNGRELHSSFVDRRLVAAQLHHYGFYEESYTEVSPIRYVQVFRRYGPEYRPVLAPLKSDPKNGFNDVFEVYNGNSLVHIGSLDSYDITEGGIAAAKKFLQAIEKNDLNAAREAKAMYDRLIPNENFGGEFTALQWFCELMLASPDEKARMLKDPMDRAYFDYLAGDDYDLLKEYVKLKYKLLKPGEQTKLSEDPQVQGPPVTADEKSTEKQKAVRERTLRLALESAKNSVGKTERAFLEDFILFNNPRRTQWENTEKIISHLPIKPGDKIADVGCGSGYFSFRFSKLVGPSGRVYAMDIKQPHLDFIEDYRKKQGIDNVSTVLASVEDIKLPEQVDLAYMCSLYHIIYGVSSEEERRRLVNSIKRALKPGGTFIVVDNGPVEDNTLPYHGPYIARELTISQLEHYGFKFEGYEQIIPQRYLLKFRLVSP